MDKKENKFGISSTVIRPHLLHEDVKAIPQLFEQEYLSFAENELK
jgi:hypothetical protein